MITFLRICIIIVICMLIYVLKPENNRKIVNVLTKILNSFNYMMNRINAKLK